MPEAELTFTAFGEYFDLIITYPALGLLPLATSVSGTVGGSAITGLTDYFGLDTIGVTYDYPFVTSNGITFKTATTSYEIEADYNPAKGLVPDVFTSAANVYDEASGIMLTLLPCFVSGTRLATTTGPVPVESLQVGDLVRTVSGQDRPVRWIGHRHVATHRNPKPDRLWPVCVRSGAFSPAVPLRDLWLSPDHAVFFDGVLIPIRYLVNDRTIVQVPRDNLTYWHVELEAHDVILAEGLPCESYLDTGNRNSFTNGGLPVALHPEFAARMWDAMGCAPIISHGAELDAARRLLLNRAAGLDDAAARDPEPAPEALAR